MSLSIPSISNPSGPLPSFLPFPRLPKDLRLQIWALASAPRVLTICKHFSYDKDRQYLYSTDPIPGIFHACHESRAESPYVASYKMGDRPRYTWANFNIDTIRTHDSILHHIKPEEIMRIRYAFLDVHCTSEFNSSTKNEMHQIESLQELTIYQIADLRVWIEISKDLLYWLECASRSQPGWTPPIIRIIERKTGEQLDSQNSAEKSALLMTRRESFDGSGWEDSDELQGKDWEGADWRLDRRKIETVLRSGEVLGYYAGGILAHKSELGTSSSFAIVPPLR